MAVAFHFSDENTYKVKPEGWCLPDTSSKKLGDKTVEEYLKYHAQVIASETIHVLPDEEDPIDEEIETYKLVREYKDAIFKNWMNEYLKKSALDNSVSGAAASSS
jgi:hypothetical protein